MTCKNYTDEEFINLIELMIYNDWTFRQMQEKKHIPKSTFHYAIHDRLPSLNPSLYESVKLFLNRHTLQCSNNIK